MKLVDFWACLPGEWLFERNISNGLHQTGVLKVEEIDSTLCQAHETGRYTDSHQVFFRNYRFEWANDSLNIFGENPKEGFVLLHELSDAKNGTCISAIRIFMNLNYMRLASNVGTRLLLLPDQKRPCSW